MRTITLSDADIGNLSDALDDLIELVHENAHENTTDEERENALKLVRELIDLANRLTPARIDPDLYDL